MPKTFIVIGIFFIIVSLLIFGIELFILCKTGNFDLKIFLLIDSLNIKYNNILMLCDDLFFYLNTHNLD